MIRTFVNLLMLTALLIFSGCELKQTVTPQSDGSYVVSYGKKDKSVEKNSPNSKYDDRNVVNEDKKLQVTKQHIAISQDRQANVTTQASLEATINSLATQMMRNKKMNSTKPVLITSFVRLDNFKKTTEFGRIVSESLINEMSNKGFNIIEYRGQMAVSVNEQGEYFITRNPYKLKDEVPNTYVVVGTYSRQFGKVMLNARVMDNITGKIITSARATYKHNRRNDCIIFKDCKPARTIKIIKEK